MQISKIKKILNRCACSKKLEFFHGWLRSSCAILSSPSFCSTEWPIMLLFLLNGMLVYYKMLSYSFFKFLCQFSGTIYLFYFMKPIQVVFWIVQYSRENFVHCNSQWKGPSRGWFKDMFYFNYESGISDVVYSLYSGYCWWSSAWVSSSSSFWNPSFIPVEDWRWGNWSTNGLWIEPEILFF